MSRMPGKRILVGVLMSLSASPIVTAQEMQPENKNLVNWYYAAALGTGFYKIGDQRAFVLRLPLAREMRPVEGDRWGWRLTFPTTVGFHDYDYADITSASLPNELTTVSVAPGAEFLLPVRSYWMLKPYGNLGYRRDLTGDDGAWLYAVGLRSVVDLPHKPTRFSFGSSVVVAGYSPDGREASQSLVGLAAGFDIQHPVGQRGFALGGFLVYKFYLDELEFLQPTEEAFEIEDEYEIAFTVGLPKPVSLWLFSFDRIGLAYRDGGSDLTVVRIVFGFPF